MKRDLPLHGEIQPLPLRLTTGDTAPADTSRARTVASAEAGAAATSRARLSWTNLDGDASAGTVERSLSHRGISGRQLAVARCQMASKSERLTPVALNSLSALISSSVGTCWSPRHVVPLLAISSA